MPSLWERPVEEAVRVEDEDEADAEDAELAEDDGLRDGMRARRCCESGAAGGADGGKYAGAGCCCTGVGASESIAGTTRVVRGGSMMVVGSKSG